jgi:hypothetical protein
MMVFSYFKRRLHLALFFYISINFIHCKNYVADAKNESKLAIGVFCDLAKCFNTISLSILVKKLSKIGINGIELDGLKII